MSANPKRLPTRVFRAGNSQAVRIPKAFELPEGEAIIEQRTGGLFIKLKRGSWTEFFAKPPLEADLNPIELRSTGSERSVNFDLSEGTRPVRRRSK